MFIMEKIDTVDALFIRDLQTLHSVEEQLLPALTKMAVAADAPELRAGLASHLEQTRRQLHRIEQALREISEAPGGETSHGIEGLIAEAEVLMSATSFGPVLDSALIEVARKVEQFEIAAYRATIARAFELGFGTIAALLEWNLQEEELVDYRLQQLAEGLTPYSGPGSDPRDDGSEVVVGRG